MEFIYTYISITLALISTVSASSFKHTWLLEGDYIPIKNIRRDCNDGQLWVKFIHKVDPSCAARTTKINQYEKYLQLRILQCYKNPGCTRIPWSYTSLTCSTSSNERQDLHDVLLETTCQIEDKLTLYRLDKSMSINASMPKCSDGRNQRVKHMFTLSPCPKSLQLSSEDSAGREWLKYDIEQCGVSCPLVNISNYNLRKWSCQQGGNQVENAGLGVYWTCNTEYPAILPPPFTRPIPTGPSTGSERPEAKEASSVEMKKSYENIILRYQIALIVITLFFVICVVLLVAASYYFICYKKRHGKRSLFDGTRPRSRPPSRQTLCSRTDSVGSARSRQSDRYVHESHHNEKNAKLEEFDEEYAVPMVDDKPYENTEEDTYETIETDMLKSGQPSSSPPKRGDTYVPMQKKQPPRRDNSGKYSYGYLVPNAMRKSKR